jgi:glycosyltransferase involved in cell wall biosynthesis
MVQIRLSCELQAKNLDLTVQFHGYLDRPTVHHYLAKSHFFMLPSSNEGFPKVIAEAACYGTIPVVSNVSSIKHYLNDENGFVWDLNGKVTYSEVVQSAFETSNEKLLLKANKIQELAELFTFDHYYFHLCNSVLNLKSKK